jgi:hypothetical protein
MCFGIIIFNTSSVLLSPLTDDYEYKMIRRQLKIKEADMAEFKRQIADLEAYLKSYIRVKDDVHKRLRSIRDKK